MAPTQPGDEELEEEEEDSLGLTIGVIVAICIVAEILIVAGLYLYHRRWKRHRQVLDTDQQETQEEQLPKD
jgi:Na+-transporting NADH:ubiquinone oxidoreductase subunit NqrC